jgi:hypothetical protein
MLGEFSNVVLSLGEHQKLRSRYGEAVTVDYIERLSCWLKNNPRKKRSSHYATILTWVRKDKTHAMYAQAMEPQTPLMLEMEQYHRAECLFNVNLREGYPKTMEQCLAAIRRLDAEKGGV